MPNNLAIGGRWQCARIDRAQRLAIERIEHVFPRQGPYPPAPTKFSGT